MKIQFIDTNLLTRGRLEVAITRAESPLLFWVQLKSGWNDLMELEEALNLRMPQRSAHLHIGPENMKENMDVAVKDFRIWRRGFIKEINKTTLMVQVILGDWGRTTWCRMSDVYLLEDRFKNLSWQGIMCGLAHTGPPPTNITTWPEGTRNLCWMFLSQHDGWINIIHPLRKGAALVEIHVYTDKTEDISFNFKDTLVRMGHVQLTSEVTVDVYPAA
ncbi:unnamed protein product [Lasius platythorax]|uniref:Tudor domain-containing protein n=1 Tax=Lasius platythorax TaxID=488582 RepID=A0AAV2NXZ1_9HYME